MCHPASKTLDSTTSARGVSGYATTSLHGWSGRQSKLMAVMRVTIRRLYRGYKPTYYVLQVGLVVNKSTPNLNDGGMKRAQGLEPYAQYATAILWRKAWQAITETGLIENLGNSMVEAWFCAETSSDTSEPLSQKNICFKQLPLKGPFLETPYSGHPSRVAYCNQMKGPTRFRGSKAEMQRYPLEGVLLLPSSLQILLNLTGSGTPQQPSNPFVRSTSTFN